MDHLRRDCPIVRQQQSFGGGYGGKGYGGRGYNGGKGYGMQRQQYQMQPQMQQMPQMMQQAPMVAQIQPMMQQQAQAGMQAQSVMQEIMAPAGDQQQAIQQAPAAAGQQPQQHQPQMVAMVQPIPGQAQQQRGRAMAAKNWRQPTLTMIMQRKVIKAPTPISSSTATETGEKPSTTTAWREERGKRNSHNMPGHANWLLRQQAATSARAAQQQTQQEKA